ncbi:hypothetical protein Tco_1115816 [Tanacetum coccineum]
MIQTSYEVRSNYQDPEGDILILDAILNSEHHTPTPPNHEQFMPEVRKELKLCEAKTVEPSIDEPPEVELKELPPHLEYAFLEGDNKLPSENGLIPKIHDVIRRRLKKLLDAGLILPSLDSLWVSRITRVPKKGENLTKPPEKTTSLYYSWIPKMLERLQETNTTVPRRLLGLLSIPIDKRSRTRQRSHAPFGNFLLIVACFWAMNAPGYIPKMYDGNLPRFDEENRWKIEVIAKLPHPTSVKGVRSFLGHAGFYRRFIQDFSKIARPMTHLLEKETPLSFHERLAIGAVLWAKKKKHFQPYYTMIAKDFMNEASNPTITTEKNYVAVCMAFETFPVHILFMSKSIVYTDHFCISIVFAKKELRQDSFTVDLIAPRI